MTDLPEYYERPIRGWYQFTWDGTNFADLQSFFANNPNTSLVPQLNDSTIVFDLDGSRMYVNPGDILMLSKDRAYPIKVTAGQLADGWAPIAGRP